MTHDLLGIHHVTAIAGDAQSNLDFYTEALGMRLVKLTVNFDDPGAYHFYFGDELGRPGSALTFFPHPGGFPGVPGAGQATTVSLAVPTGSLDAWAKRLKTGDFSTRFGERVLTLSDPDGLRVELIETEDADAVDAWRGGPLSSEMAIRGIHSVTISSSRFESNDRFFTKNMGFHKIGDEDGRTRYRVGSGIGSIVDVVHNESRGRVAVGSVHHVAFRVSNDDEQAHWLRKTRDLGLQSSPVMERDYFRSIYFREPGGVLFEIATDGPGMTIDEPADALGQALRLPARYESHREEIERNLPPLRLPQAVGR